MSDYDDFLAARYALGVADLSEIVTAESRLEIDPTFGEKVSQFDLLFYGLERDIDPIAPSEGLWDRIEVAIDDLEKSPGTETVRADAIAWEPFLPAVERRILKVDIATATSLVLYKLAPGASVGSHGHCVIEECLVLEGEIEVDGLIVSAGDLHMAFPNERHGPITSRTGALLYIRGDALIQP
jgi:anti-sigma factor ChrR (cupin superfamily)